MVSPGIMVGSNPERLHKARKEATKYLGLLAKRDAKSDLYAELKLREDVREGKGTFLRE